MRMERFWKNGMGATENNMVRQGASQAVGGQLAPSPPRHRLGVRLENMGG